MYRIRSLVAAAALLTGLGLLTWAAEPEKSEQPKQLSKEALAKYKEAAEKIDNLQLADSLAAYGDREKSPTALLLAAEILADVRPKAGELKSEDGKTTLKNEPLMPEDLVKKARDLSDSPHIVALCDACEKRCKEAGKGREPYPISGNTVLRGAAIYDHEFRNNEPAILYASCPGGEVVTVKVMNMTDVPPHPVREQTGSNVRLDWFPHGDGPTSTYKFIITPLSPPGFKVQWGTN